MLLPRSTTTITPRPVRRRQGLVLVKSSASLSYNLQPPPMAAPVFFSSLCLSVSHLGRFAFVPLGCFACQPWPPPPPARAAWSADDRSKSTIAVRVTWHREATASSPIRLGRLGDDRGRAAVATPGRRRRRRRPCSQKAPTAGFARPMRTACTVLYAGRAAMEEVHARTCVQCNTYMRSLYGSVRFRRSPPLGLPRWLRLTDAGVGLRVLRIASAGPSTTPRCHHRQQPRLPGQIWGTGQAGACVCCALYASTLPRTSAQGNADIQRRPELRVWPRTRRQPMAATLAAHAYACENQLRPPAPPLDPPTHLPLSVAAIGVESQVAESVLRELSFNGIEPISNPHR
ncbi:hypothetical protein CDD83_3663 [Cordyceps sp. RAO-2017]|nr:hypothetical protein CDD83_3663 [Cordyceps sp. RAO-2017]